MEKRDVARCRPSLHPQRSLHLPKLAVKDELDDDWGSQVQSLRTLGGLAGSGQVAWLGLLGVARYLRHAQSSVFFFGM